jgi:hypothetical protein
MCEGIMPNKLDIDPKIGKGHLGNASQFFVAGELCMRGHSAVVTLGNTPNLDILWSDLAGTKFAHIQVKTFRRGAERCMVGTKAEIHSADSFFWVLTGLPKRGDADRKIEYFVIPTKIMRKRIKLQFKEYLATPGAKGQQRKETGMRTVAIPPRKNRLGWSIEKFRNRWDLIDEWLR